MTPNSTDGAPRHFIKTNIDNLAIAQVVIIAPTGNLDPGKA